MHMRAMWIVALAAAMTAGLAIGSGANSAGASQTHPGSRGAGTAERFSAKESLVGAGGFLCGEFVLVTSGYLVLRDIIVRNYQEFLRQGSATYVGVKMVGVKSGTRYTASRQTNQIYHSETLLEGDNLVVNIEIHSVAIMQGSGGVLRFTQKARLLVTPDAEMVVFLELIREDGFC